RHSIAQSQAKLAATPNNRNVGFGRDIKQISAGSLNIGYVDVGPSDGPVALLVHGWPYDIYSFAEVTPRLVAAGYRVIVPYLRGYGSTAFLSAQTPRNGQQAIFAVDMIALLDTLN